MSLTIKQKKFADIYLETGNATKAAVEAGYNAKYAATNTDKLLKNTKIKNYIDERLKELDNEAIAKQEEILKTITAILRSKYSKDVDKLRAAKLLMQKYGMFTPEEEDKDVIINISLEE
ncbi:terminase small subunit [Clostridium paraputrificum]|uniref:terminase small subunit n=1 Tax=Clostridium paraputrificum TaxID=29363 RepID=UPI000428A90C|nr:terminase small subunit [Clostridium paraputrificum]